MEGHGVSIKRVTGQGSKGELEWWSGGVVEWWSGGVVEWWSGGVVPDLPGVLRGLVPLSQNLANHSPRNIGKPEVASGVAVGETLMIQS
jgi:hypothetical protein